MDIAKAAAEYASREWTDGIESDVSKSSFIAGAEYRINSVWHDATELPESGHHVTVMFSEGNIAGCNLDVSQKEMLEAFKASGVVKWAYSHDLIPSKEDEK